MTSKLEDRLLILVTQAEKAKIDAFRLGTTLEKKSGLTINQLAVNALKDRLMFARQTLRDAKTIAKNHKNRSRLIVSRSYYALYHTARAVVYFHEGGDDFQEHSRVPDKLPRDFPDRETWQNRLKTARLERNRADYEPYPAEEKQFAAMARNTLEHADLFLKAVKQYLRKNGCAI